MPRADAPQLSVSVVIPTYNHARFVEAAVESALNQTRLPNEIIVIDDGSTDETDQVLSRFQFPVRVIRQKNCGRSAARNAGLRAAQSDLIVFLDSDDLLVPDSIERRAKMFEDSPELGVVYGEMYVVNSAGEKMGLHAECMPGVRPSGYILSELAMRCFILMPAMIRRSAIGSHLFDETLSHAEDYDLWRRLSATTEFRYVDRPIACYRMHDSNTVTSQPTRMLEAELEVQRRFFEMPAFQALSRKERGRVYCCHGVKNAVLSRSAAARRYLALAAWTAPLVPANQILFLLGSVSPRLLAWIVLERRRRNRKQLGGMVESAAAPVTEPEMACEVATTC